MEKWLPVPGYEGFYEVSDQGRVRSVTREVKCRNGAVRTFYGTVLSPRRSADDYLSVALWRDSTVKNRLVHHLVAEAFIGPRPQGLVVRHLNDVPDDNRVDNLAYGTMSENRYDSVRNGGHHNSRKTFCKRGHLLAEPNLYRSTSLNKRTCVSCNRGHVKAASSGHKTETLVKSLSDGYYAEIMEAHMAA